MLELSFADHAKLQKEGRNFDCSTCKFQSLRRCHEPRWDFSFETDGNPWPLYVSSPKGELYGFCPSKVARDDYDTTSLFNTMVVVAETGQLLTSGGIVEQPAWFIDELSWFLPKYSSYKFARQASMLFGEEEKKPSANQKAKPSRKQRV